MQPASISSTTNTKHSTISLTLNPISVCKMSVFQKHPSLYSIWSPELAELASFHTLQFEQSLPGFKSGEVYLIYLQDTLLGIIGWYEMTAHEAGLRWHGILPEFRKNGYSKQAIRLVCELLPKNITHLYEVTRSPASCSAFLKSGFQIIYDQATINHAVEHADYDISSGGWVLVKPLLR